MLQLSKHFNINEMILTLQLSEHFNIMQYEWDDTYIASVKTLHSLLMIIQTIVQQQQIMFVVPFDRPGMTDKIGTKLLGK